jgi:ferredoxin
MIITEQKTIGEIIDSLKGHTLIFLVGCGECSTVCKTGGQPELVKMRQELESGGKQIVGTCIPAAPCLASQVKIELAKNMKFTREMEETK